MKLPLCFLVVSVSILSCPDVANAATVTRTPYQNAGSACTGALPTYEGALRKRPKAIANEGTGLAFVTCSAPANDSNSRKPQRLFLWVFNRSTSTVSLSCTMVNGDEFNGSTATPATATVAPGVLTPLLWQPVSPATEFERSALSVSCALPPQVEINLVGQVIDEDIGD